MESVANDAVPAAWVPPAGLLPLPTSDEVERMRRDLVILGVRPADDSDRAVCATYVEHFTV